MSLSEVGETNQFTHCAHPRLIPLMLVYTFRQSLSMQTPSHAREFRATEAYETLLGQKMQDLALYQLG